jgi:hypothetical protein
MNDVGVGNDWALPSHMLDVAVDRPVEYTSMLNWGPSRGIVSVLVVDWVFVVHR